MFDFSDRIVIVTGAGGNLGQAVARAFAETGAVLALADRHPEQIAAQFKTVEPDRLLIQSADLTDPASVSAFVSAVLDRFGHIDVLANTVGGYRAGTPVHETPLETLDFMLNLNTRTAFLISQAVIPSMLDRKSGAIIHVAARGGLTGAAKMAAYSIAKSAVIRLTESLNAELRQQGIRVNCVLPGTIDTPQNRAEMPDADFSRWVSPQALADVILFLASDAARAVMGAAIPVYGRS